MKHLLLLPLLLLLPVHDKRAAGTIDPDTKQWFKGLKSKLGACCSDTDGTALSDPEWRIKDGHYQVTINKQWRDVPDEAVLTEPNKVGYAMVWPMTYEDGSIVIRCFLPGEFS